MSDAQNWNDITVAIKNALVEKLFREMKQQSYIIGKYAETVC